eukprot:182880-Rhodomonas_salina.1
MARSGGALPPTTSCTADGLDTRLSVPSTCPRWFRHDTIGRRRLELCHPLVQGPEKSLARG